MDMSNPLYKNQGIYVNIVTFTVEDSMVKVLLVKRRVEPFVGEWIIPGGAVYNNESTDFAAARELKEKTGLEGLNLQQFYAFSEPNRDPRMRLVSIAYLALVDKNKVDVLQQTPDTLDADWYCINKTPDLGFDHNEMLKMALHKLRQIITQTNLVKDLLPEQFTMPQLQKIYESILDKKLDRRNFRRKFLSLGIIEPTGTQKENVGHRPALLYKFADNEYKEIEIF